MSSGFELILSLAGLIVAVLFIGIYVGSVYTFGRYFFAAVKRSDWVAAIFLIIPLATYVLGGLYYLVTTFLR